MPRQPRGKRTTTAHGGVEVAAKNASGDGSLYFEPARTSKDGKVRPGYWRASYRDADGTRRTVPGPTRVQAWARREVKLRRRCLRSGEGVDDQRSPACR